jgi:hypothetical protein
MRKVFLCSIFLGLAGWLMGADDPFTGTWKLNAAKSKLSSAQPGMAMKEETMVVQETGTDAVVTLSGTRENGSTISIKNATPIKGGPVTYSEGGPPSRNICREQEGQ